MVKIVDGPGVEAGGADQGHIHGIEIVATAESPVGPAYYIQPEFRVPAPELAGDLISDVSQDICGDRAAVVYDLQGSRLIKAIAVIEKPVGRRDVSGNTLKGIVKGIDIPAPGQLPVVMLLVVTFGLGVIAHDLAVPGQVEQDPVPVKVPERKRDAARREALTQIKDFQLPHLTS